MKLLLFIIARRRPASLIHLYLLFKLCTKLHVPFITETGSDSRTNCEEGGISSSSLPCMSGSPSECNSGMANDQYYQFGLTCICFITHSNNNYSMKEVTLW